MPAGKRKVASKLCVRCRKVHPLGEFYANSGWKEQSYCDAYCKSCAKAVCKDKASVREYFWCNNRLWDERIWDSAEKKAQYKLATDAEYLSTRTSKQRKEEIAAYAAAQQCLAVMNMACFYRYSANVTEDGEYVKFDPDSRDGTLVIGEDGSEEAMSSAKRYSREWNGYYTQSDLDFLEDYYSQLESDFALGDVVMRDTAKKVAKAALADDKTYNAMLEGKGSVADWKNAHDVYEKILQSTNFAASQRKGSGNEGMKAMGTIIAAVELQRDIADLCRTQKFPEDDVDRILRDFRHTEVAIQ